MTLVTMLEILAPLLFSTIVILLPDFFYFPMQTRYQLVYIPSKSRTLKAIMEMVEKSFDIEFEVQSLCGSRKISQRSVGSGQLVPQPLLGFHCTRSQAGPSLGSPAPHTPSEGCAFLALQWC
ncbi:hypothetical protein GH733_012281 [Mirounga leonina]|nr:hypothetical protein GH733_012281 [Mirounga leonina]